MKSPHAQIITAAARDALAPLGLRQKGRSRTWIDDHGWWLINIEFQPSSWTKGSYLNVGEQHLWIERDHLIFEHHERPAGRAFFVEYDGDDSAFAEAVARLANLAVEAVRRRRTQHHDGHRALRRIAASGDDFNAGIANALLGRTRRAGRRLQGLIHPAYQAPALTYIEHVKAGMAEEHARSIVRRTRSLLKLPDAAQSFWA